MPGKVKVRILAGRNLPVMDRANDTTDAFVEIRLGTVTQKTDVCRRSLNPQWNSDWFRFEVQDDAELQDEPLQIRVMDHDTYSAHDAIGKVYLSLSPLLTPELVGRADAAAPTAGGPSLISGWIPIYDTLHGIRGEVNVMVKVDLFSDFNKFRHSSCGVQYFSSPCVPAGHCVQAMLGFVHELVVNDDPEYQWIDKIRTPRASNEARQTLFSKLSGEVQRRIGVTVIEAGGNAVIGYRQCFDLEGETGIVVRGIGTAVSLLRTDGRSSSPSPLTRQPGSGRDRDGSTLASEPPAALAGLRPVPSVQLVAATPEQELPPDTPPSPRPFAAAAPQPRGILAAAQQFVRERLSFRRRSPRRVGNAARALSREAFSTPNFQPVAAGGGARAGPDGRGRRRRLTSSCDGTPRGLNTLNTADRTDTDTADTDTGGGGDGSADPSDPGEDDVEEDVQDDGDAAGSDDEEEADDDDGGRRPVMVISSSEGTASESAADPADIPESTLHLALDTLSVHDVVYISSMNMLVEVASLYPSLSTDNACDDDDEPVLDLESFPQDYLDSLDMPAPHPVKFTLFPDSSESLSNADEAGGVGEPVTFSLYTDSVDSLCGLTNRVDGRPAAPVPLSSRPGQDPSSRAAAESVTERRSSPAADPVQGCAPRPELATVVSELFCQSGIVCRSGDVESLLLCEEACDPQLERLDSGGDIMWRPDGSPGASPPGGSLELVSQMDSCEQLASSSSAGDGLRRRDVFGRLTPPRRVMRYVASAPEVVCRASRSFAPDPSAGSLFSEDCELAALASFDSLVSVNSASDQALGLAPTDPACLPGAPEMASLHSVSSEQLLAMGSLPAGEPVQSPGTAPPGVDRQLTSSDRLVPPPVPPQPRRPSPVASPAGRPCPSGSVSSVGGAPRRRRPACKAAGADRPPDGPCPPCSDPCGSPHLPQPAAAVPAAGAHVGAPEPADTGDKLSRSLENDAPFKATSSTTSSGADTKLLAQLVTSSAQQRGQQQENYESAEFPFITLRTFSPGFITHIGGTVSARSVKLLDRIHHPEESETRDAWWTEARTEVRSHCKALACNVVLGYEETTTIWDDVCVLSAYGTAATVNFAALGLASTRCDTREVRSALRLDASLNSQALVILDDPDMSTASCAPCHLPYSQASAPVSALQVTCAVCRKNKVPDVIFSTIEPPLGLSVTGRGCLVQARVCREKADVKSEALAKEISDRLPFLEYELHRQLLNKLRILGMNALFDLTIQLSIGEEMMVAVATATAAFLTALPPPVVPRVTSAVQDGADHLVKIQQTIAETVAGNREAFNITEQDVRERPSDDDSDEEEDKPDLDLAAGNKDACILEMDDAEDADLLSMLMGPPPPELFELVSTAGVPGVPDRMLLDDRQLFTRIVRTKLSSVSNCQLAQIVEKIIQGLYFKLRKLAPCALCGLRFSIDLPEDDELQISVYGAALSVSEPLSRQPSAKSAEASDEAGGATGRLRPAQNSLWRGDYDVIITPLPHVTGGRVERWLGNLNFFFIRECTGLREVGGLNGFMQDLVTEVLAVVRAHITALGGNALVSYFMSQCVLLPNPHKNQAQCLMNVGGDAVLVGHVSRTDDG